MIRSGLLVTAAVAAGALWTAVAMGQEAEPSEPASVGLRPAWIACREVQEQDIAGVLEETTHWVQVGPERFLVVNRPAVGAAPRVTLLFLTDESGAPDGHTRSGMLRKGLARHGWHTFFARLDVGSLSADARLAQLQGLLDCARDNGSDGLVAVVVEGGAGRLVLPLASRLSSDGFVILNLPPPRTSGHASRNALSVMQTPSLLVQESPLGWPEDQAVGPGVHLLRLPPGHSGRDDDRELRRLRGWLQHQAAG